MNHKCFVHGLIFTLSTIFFKHPSLDELLELRKLRQRPAGVTAADLLIGDTTGKKKKKDKVAAPADPWKLSSGGGLVDLDEVRRQEEGYDIFSLNDCNMLQKGCIRGFIDSLTPFFFLQLYFIANSEGSSKSTGILNSFTKQTNALDVDKHMMKYIEEEMRKRNGVSAEDEEVKAQESRGGDTDIYDELGIRRTAPKPEQEGNVQLSTTMLTAIPEVDLGME